MIINQEPSYYDSIGDMVSKEEALSCLRFHGGTMAAERHNVYIADVYRNGDEYHIYVPGKEQYMIYNSLESVIRYLDSKDIVIPDDLD